MSTLHEEILNSKENEEEIKGADRNWIKYTQKENYTNTTNEFRSIYQKLPILHTYELFSKGTLNWTRSIGFTVLLNGSTIL